MLRTLRLTVIEDGVSTVVEFDQPVISIGRALDNQIRLRDAQVSRRHAHIERVGEDLVLVDDESANGTRLNGSGVDRSSVKQGDWIEIGKTRIGIGEIDAPSPADGSGRLHALPAGGQDTFVSVLTRERDNLLVLQRINRAI